MYVVVMFVCMFYKEGVKAESNLRRLPAQGVREDKNLAFPLLRNILHLQKREYKYLKKTGEEFSQFLRVIKSFITHYCPT